MNVGGKARSLLALRDAGLPVPPFVVLAEDELASRVAALPEAYLEGIRAAFPADALLAVRSSAGDEDGADHSFAGLFATELFVRPADLAGAIRRVWDSAFSERVATYRRTRGLPAARGLSIVVQLMVDAEVSGVAFGLHPVTGERTVTVINAVYGLGEGLVSGQLPADQYEVRQGAVTRVLADKRAAFVFDRERGTGLREQVVDSGRAALACLEDAQVLEVAAALARVTRLSHRYQDLEFAFAGNTLYVLQARPVTGVEALADSGGRAVVWDNSNIIESYPGVTSPLTFSFITEMYASVYRQLSELLGIEPQVIAENGPVYEGLLGLLNGRVYYHLTNWHRCLALLPGYEANAEFMDRMMGVKEPFERDRAPVKLSGRELRRVLRAVFHILAVYRRVERERQAFLKHVHAVLDDYEGRDWADRRLEDLADDYTAFETTLLTKWKAPLVNDFFAMIFFGLLQKTTPEGLHNELVSGAGDIVSVEPARQTRRIVELIRADAAWAKRLQDEDPERLWSSVEHEASAVMDAIRTYLRRFGDRTVGELKLETATYRQEPWKYLALLRPQVAGTPSPERAPAARGDAEARAESLLRRTPLKRALWRFILKRARYFVSHRENLRFERTRGFGMVRRLFLAMGERLYAEHKLAAPRDIFFLEKREIFDYVRGRSTNQDLAALVAYRRAAYERWEELPVSERVTTRGGVYVGNDFAPRASTAVTQGDLQGVGCCAGVVRARVRVLHRPEAGDLEGKILVTSSTDPGWVPLFPVVAGILVERGSLLSHSAIVSREMGIPCVVGVAGLLSRLNDGDLVEMDGKTGAVRVLEASDGR